MQDIRLELHWLISGPGKDVLRQGLVLRFVHIPVRFDPISAKVTVQDFVTTIRELLGCSKGHTDVLGLTGRIWMGSCEQRYDRRVQMSCDGKAGHRMEHGLGAKCTLRPC